MEKSLIGWHSFSFHCKFVSSSKQNGCYRCLNEHSNAHGKECHANNCMMFNGSSAASSEPATLNEEQAQDG